MSLIKSPTTISSAAFDDMCELREAEKRIHSSAATAMPLIMSLPAPVLSVAPDAVRQLESGDALGGLWAVFSKCKNSIQNGRRLENVAWRLWYREMMISNAAIEEFREKEGDEFGYGAEDVPPCADQPRSPIEEEDNSKEIFTSLMPTEPERTSDTGGQEKESRMDGTKDGVEGVAPAPPYQRTRDNFEVDGTEAPPSVERTRPLSSQSFDTPTAQRRKKSFLAGSRPMSVGKFICDMIPSSQPLVVAPPPMSDVPIASSAYATASAPAASNDTEPMQPGVGNVGQVGLSPQETRSPRLAKDSATSQLQASEPTDAPPAVVSSQYPYHSSSTPAMGCQCGCPCECGGGSSAGVHGSPPRGLGSPARPSSSSSSPALLPHLALGLPTIGGGTICFSEDGGPSQLPTPGVETDSRAAPLMLRSNQESAMTSEDHHSVNHPSTTMLLPPSPSLSDSYARAHPDAVSLVAACAEAEGGVGDRAQGSMAHALSSNMNLASSLSRVPHPTSSATTTMSPSHSNSATPKASTTPQQDGVRPPPCILAPTIVTDAHPSSLDDLHTPPLPPPPPKLVIVNPTPGPSPQPTPPHTPLFQAIGQPMRLFQDTTGHLLPPGATSRSRGGTRGDDQDGGGEEEEEEEVVPHLSLGPPLSSSPSERSDTLVGSVSSAKSALAKGTVKVLEQVSHQNRGVQPEVYGVVNPTTTTIDEVIPQQKQPERAGGRAQGHKPTSSITSVTSVASTTSQKSSKSATASTARAPGMKRAATAGTGARGGKKGAALGGRSRSNVHVAAGVSGKAASRSRSRGREAGTTAVGAMTSVAEPPASPSSPVVTAPAPAPLAPVEKAKATAAASGKKGRSHSSGNARRPVVASGKSRRGSSVRGRGAPLQALTGIQRTSSHEEVNGQDDDGDNTSDFDSEFTDEEGVEEEEVVSKRGAQLAREVQREEEAREARLAELKKGREEAERKREEMRVSTEKLEALRKREVVARQVQIEQQRVQEDEQLARHVQQRRPGALVPTPLLQQQQQQQQLGSHHSNTNGHSTAACQSRKSKFNIGSNSDDGSVSNVASKSGGSGSEDMPLGGQRLVGHTANAALQQLGRRPGAANQQQLADALEAERVQQRLREEEEERERERARLAKEADAKKQQQLQSQSQDKGKGKGKEKAAAVGTLPSPLLPEPSKKTYMLTSESSEYTDTDSDSLDWISEDGPNSNKAHESSTRSSQPRRHSHTDVAGPSNTQHQRPAAVPEQPPPVQRLAQYHRPGLNRTHSHASGAQRQKQQRELQRQAQLNLERAAAQLQREEEEARRLRDMFVKKPTSSFQNLTRLGGMTAVNPLEERVAQQALGEAQRTQSVGLLSRLMNPDPRIFPVEHPYRRGYSSGEIPRLPVKRGEVGLGAMGAFGPLTSIQQQRPGPTPLQAPQQQQVQHQKPRTEAAGPPPPPPPPSTRQEVGGTTKHAVQQQTQGPPAPRTREAPPAGPSTQQPPSPSRAESSKSSQHSALRSQHSRQTSQTSLVSSIVPRGMRLPGLQPGKSMAAKPVMNDLVTTIVSRPPSLHSATSETAPPVSSQLSGGTANSQQHRPRGPPAGQELEETDAESDADNALDMPKSIAQKKLMLFAQKRGIATTTSSSRAGSSRDPGTHAEPPPHHHLSSMAQVQTRPEDHDDVPRWAREPPPPEEVYYAQPETTSPPLAVPIPLVHPYNLPPSAMPTTPRTTRRMMMKNELSESLRRGLLHQRHSGAARPAPLRRAASTTGVVTMPNSPSMVQLHPREPGGTREPDVRGSGDRTRRASGSPDKDRKRPLPRTKSHVTTYHISGW